MQWASAISRAEDTTSAIREVSEHILGELDAPPDLSFVFASEHHRSGFDALPVQLRERLGAGRLLGSSAGGVIGGALEVEQQPALSLVSARLPDVALAAWHIEATELRPDSEHSRRCATLARSIHPDTAQFIVLADPFSFPTEQLLHSLESGLPDAVIAGGLASGGMQPGETALFLNDQCFHSGALLLSLSGDIEMDTAVAQGCRPIGEPMFVTEQRDNVLSRIDERPPIEVINSLYEQADERDQGLMQHSLFIGLAMRAGDTRYHQGDYLIRNLVGADQQTGAIQVGANLYPNQVVQFHLRDAQTSAEDLAWILDRTKRRYPESAPEGALLFSCAGRGQGLYGQAGHDSEMFQQQLGPVPLGGFFCNGEIGPVAGKTFLHGYTSAFALFRPRQKTQDRPT